MSRTIEQKVVEMRFDNSNFEKNVSSSIDSLNKLQDTINKTSSGNAFAELGKAADNVNFSGLTASIQTVTESFNWLEQIAIGALRRIGENIQQHLVEALNKVTFANIQEGWDRFADKTESVQTILSAIATEDYGDVNKLDYTESLLEKLAWFSDETSYNFKDMTSNIAKFTAAGLNLDDSTTAMIGIANWAANAGQNAQTASRAMYQLSQAMGMGSIRLMDWKSIETANMATKEVKQLLIEYGKLHNTVLTDQNGQDYIMYQTGLMKEAERMDISAEKFRDSLKGGWLTAEIFADAMAEYASYSEALYKVLEKNNEGRDADEEIIASELISAFDEAITKSKETGKAIEDIMMEDYSIDIMVEDENGTLKSAIDGVTELAIRAMKSAQQARTWRQVVDSITDAASTQWSFIFENIFGNVEEATELFTHLSEFFYDVFVEPLKELKKLIKGWKTEGRALLFDVDDKNETVSALENLEAAVTALLSAIKLGFSGIVPKMTSERLVDLTKKFRDFTGTLVMSEKTVYKVGTAIRSMLTIVKSIGGVFTSVFGAVKRIFGQILTQFNSVFGEGGLFGKKVFFARNNIETFFVNLFVAIKQFISGIKLSESALGRVNNIFRAFANIITIVGTALGNLAAKIAGSALAGKFKSLGESISGKFFDVILWLPEKIAMVISNMADFITQSEGIHKFTDAISTAFKQTKQFISGFMNAMIPAGTIGKIFENIRSSISNLFGSIKDSDAFNSAKANIKGFFDEIKAFFEENVTYEKGAEAFNTVKTTLIDFGEKVGSAFTKAKDSVKEFIENSEGIKSLGEWFKNLFKPKDIEERIRYFRQMGCTLFDPDKETGN